MFQYERAIRPGLAGLVLLCFLMPFVKITCGGQPVASMSGFDLAIGKKVAPPSILGGLPSDQFSNNFSGSFGNQHHSPATDSSDQSSSFEETSPRDTAFANAIASQYEEPASPDAANSQIGGDPTAIAAVVLAVVALFAAFGAGRKAMLISAITAGLTAVALFIMKTRFSGDLPSEAMDVVGIEWTAAFWISLIGSAILAAFTAKILADNPPEREKPRLVIQSYSDNRPAQPTPR